MRRVRFIAPVTSSVVTAIAMALGAAGSTAHASFTWFKYDFAGWQSAAGAYSTCDFAAYPTNTFITDQYEDLGVLFTNPGPNVVHANDFEGFPLDGHGIDGNCGIELTFLQPVFAVAHKGPDYWKYKLFVGNTVVYVSPPANGDFAGIVSTTPFDRVQLYGAPSPDCNDDVYIDNIYFSTVPTPAASVVLAMGILAGGRRRRG